MGIKLTVTVVGVVPLDAFTERYTGSLGLRLVGVTEIENGTLPLGEVIWIVCGGGRVVESAVVVKVSAEGVATNVWVQPDVANSSAHVNVIRYFICLPSLRHVPVSPIRPRDRRLPVRVHQALVVLQRFVHVPLPGIFG